MKKSKPHVGLLEDKKDEQINQLLANDVAITVLQKILPGLRKEMVSPPADVKRYKMQKVTDKELLEVGCMAVRLQDTSRQQRV